LGIRYGDWDTAQSTPGALALRTKACQYGASYTFGAAAGQPGFGLSIAYNKSATPLPDQPLWMIGVTYQ
jgi:hypothetical protein